ncbi:thiamines/molybdopterin converting factor subunit 1 [Lucifera butyrica]|uniref:Thiamines/molybdopterin converting factor subunit 1 n=1 Tax=Lucifera butyrica TaxID=1351585 RepID=A0A498R9V9_9FIRM|nr:sulfur carrier protein ThiS [Lucifera butyrica]VBB05928.1 thiamines/molybdopterin converting factor subunit 1 [Lucifera butyrica]
MDIVVNGERQSMDAGVNIEKWLEQKGILGRHMVLELNERILVREEWSKTVLQQGDCLEIITFVGGG